MKNLLTCITGLFLSVSLHSALAIEVTQLIQAPLPPLAANQETQVLDIVLQPGEGSPIHRHNAYVYLYVLSGEVEMQVEGGELYHLSSGQTFTESVDDIHIVSRNPSSTTEARFLVFLIRTEGTPISIPVELD